MASSSPTITLEVEAELLRAVLVHLRARDVDIITMDEMHQRLCEQNFAPASPA